VVGSALSSSSSVPSCLALGIGAVAEATEEGEGDQSTGVDVSVTRSSTPQSAPDSASAVSPGAESAAAGAVVPPAAEALALTTRAAEGQDHTGHEQLTTPGVSAGSAPQESGDSSSGPGPQAGVAAGSIESAQGTAPSSTAVPTSTAVPAKPPVRAGNLFQRLAKAAMSTQTAGKGGETGEGTGQPRSRQANLFRALIRIARMTGGVAAARASRPMPGFYLKTRLNQV
jgi:hypothetical protein